MGFSSGDPAAYIGASRHDISARQLVDIGVVMGGAFTFKHLSFVRSISENVPERYAERPAVIAWTFRVRCWQSDSSNKSNHVLKRWL